MEIFRGIITLEDTAKYQKIEKPTLYKISRDGNKHTMKIKFERNDIHIENCCNLYINELCVMA